MEGTRNERVAILLTSYLIGFITAYIAFGVIQFENSLEFTQVETQHTASVIQARQQSVPLENVFLAVDKEGLVLIKNNTRTLLSLNVGNNLNNSFQDGEHVAISEYALSDDKKHVYFCELPSVTSESCRPYIYSIVDQVVYPVEINGERVAFEAEGQEISWSIDGTLLVN